MLLMSLFLTATTLSGLYATGLLAASSTQHLTASAPPRARAQEQQFMNRFERGELPVQFEAIDDLNRLYMMNRTHGGLTGMRWARDTKTALVAHVIENSRYEDFLQTEADGTIVMALPAIIPNPAFLNVAEITHQSPLITISQQPQRRRNYRAYFRLADLLSEVDHIPAVDVSRWQHEPVIHGTIAPITLTKSHRSADYMIINGLEVALGGLLDGSSYILGRVEGTSALPSAATKLTDVKLLTPDELAERARPEPIPDIPIVTKLSFTPRRDPEFPPLKMTLQRQGRDCPVIIERFSPAEAERELAGPVGAEVRHIISRTSNNPDANLILIMRTLDGEVVASSSNNISRSPSHVSLRGEGNFKPDQSRSTGIQKVGLAFTIARLLYLKRSGPWPKSATLISNFIPKVLRRYQLDAGLITEEEYRDKYLDISIDVISGWEGDRFLAANPLPIEEL